jgi:hypothetical protein
MDRSFLSTAEVIKASRSFICARLATYENEEEAKLLKGLVRTRSGELENSVFAILSSDGKTKLARAGRGPHAVASTSKQLAAALDRIAADNPAKAEPRALPLVATLKLAVNIAACDNVPLAVLSAQDGKWKALEAAAGKLVWRPGVVGKFIWVRATEDELKAIKGGKPGLTVVQPSKYGTSGEVLAQADGGEDALLAALEKGKKAHAPDLGDSWGHIKSGHRQGVFWETTLPVTDPMEKRAREKGRKK